MLKLRNWMVFAPDAGGSGAGAQDGNSQNQTQDDGKSSLTFDDWLKEQPEDVKSLLDTHTKGLKSALDDERKTRKDLEKQVRDLASKADKGSDAEKQLTGLADQIAAGERKADFYEAAHAAGVTNLKLAFLVANQDDLFDRRGQVNFEEMKKSYPELFGGVQKLPQGNAGSGTTTTNHQSSAAGMNAFIRQAAGRSK